LALENQFVFAFFKNPVPYFQQVGGFGRIKKQSFCFSPFFPFQQAFRFPVDAPPGPKSQPPVADDRRLLRTGGDVKRKVGSVSVPQGSWF
jgi:hypothetical protein